MPKGANTVVLIASIFASLCAFLYSFKKAKCWNAFISISPSLNALLGTL